MVTDSKWSIVDTATATRSQVQVPTSTTLVWTDRKTVATGWWKLN